MTKRSLLLLLIVTNLLCIWSVQIPPKCTSRQNVLKYHKCMQSIYGIENAYREACIHWNGIMASGNVTEPKCLHHLKITKESSGAKNKNKKIEVRCTSYEAYPAVHFPKNVTVVLKIQTNDTQCKQTEEVKFEFPDTNAIGKKNSKCKKPKWNKNGITVAANLTGPRAIYIDQNDNLYVTDLEHRRLQKFTNSSKTGIIVVNEANNRSVDVCIDSYGNIFKATGEQWIVKSDGSMSVKFGASNDTKDCSVGVFLNKKTDMYVAVNIGNSSSRIRKYSSTDLKTSSSKVKEDGGASTKQRYAVFVDQCDSIATVSEQEREIRTHLDSSYVPNWSYIEPSIPAPHHYYPSNMLYHFGSYYLVSRELNCVMNFLGQGVIVGVPNNAKSADAKHLNEPISMTFDTKSNLYVADFKNNRVQKFLFQSGNIKC